MTFHPLAIHCDIAVDKGPGGTFITTFGGNLGLDLQRSVRKRIFPITTSGFLVVDEAQSWGGRDQWRADLAVPARPNPPPVALDNESTGRIIAALSLVPYCVPIPVRRATRESIV